MKTKNLFTLALFCCSFLVISCKKESTPPPTNDAENVDSFSDMKANSSFSWSTYKTVNLKVKGIKQLTNEKNVFIVADLQGKNTYLKEFHAMSDDFESKVKIPSNVSSIQVSFGTITKTYATSNLNIEFDYVNN